MNVSKKINIIPIAHLDQLLALLLDVRLYQSAVDVQFAHIIYNHRISTAKVIASEHMLKQCCLPCAQKT